ncbi:MAG: shikimate dehydrogenase [Alphaproteobacteria bacterium]|nr:shikimate dehydrogenase [Alphaproteobacteria bacterium]
MNDAAIPLAGVIGSPISHSLSPRLHGFWLQKYGINGHYIPMELTRETFEKGLKSLPSLGFRGVNVTLPFKETVLALADVITDRAALIGAANTITFRKDGRIQADNTDGYGFIANVKQLAPSWQASIGPALVLGAGGASRAVISALLSEGVPEIWLANRTRNRADMLREHFGARIKVLDWTKISGELAGACTLINTTSLGMQGQQPLQIDLGRIKAGTLVTDIVYTPLQTDLLKAAAARGCVTVDGIGMLLHQAVPGFENWFRKKPKVDDALRAAVLAP